MQASESQGLNVTKKFIGHYGFKSEGQIQGWEVSSVARPDR